MTLKLPPGGDLAAGCGQFLSTHLRQNGPKGKADRRRVEKNRSRGHHLRVRTLLVLAGGAVAAIAIALAVPNSISGKITAIDLHGRTMTVKDNKSGTVTFEVPESAQIVLDGDKDQRLEDLFEGDLVEKATLKQVDSRLVLVSAVVTSKKDARDD